MIHSISATPSFATTRLLLLLFAALHYSCSFASAAVRTILISTTNHYKIPSVSLLYHPLPTGPNATSSTTNATTKCLAASGFADNYPLINDKCLPSLTRPGQNWRFDDAATAQWQPVLVGPTDDPYCLAVDTHGIPAQQNPAVADVNATVAVLRCSGIVNGTSVRDQALWTVGGNGNGTYWFRNLRNRMCMTSSDTQNVFTMTACSNSTLQVFSTIIPKQ